MLGSKMFSLLEGVFDYNKILVFDADRLKTTFTTKCGTFAYKCMPFGLMNVGDTFQHAMDIAFK